MIAPTIDKPGASEPRDLSGTAGHEALRSFWQSKKRRRSQADIITDLRRTDRERRAAKARQEVKHEN